MPVITEYNYHNRAKINARTKHQRVVWVLEQAPSVNAQMAASANMTSAGPFYYNGAKDLNRVYLTSDIHCAPWYESKYHANTCLTLDMKHEGFIAREHIIHLLSARRLYVE